MITLIRKVINRLYKRVLPLYTHLRFIGTNVTVGENCHIHPRARLKTIGGGSIILGDNCSIDCGAMLLTYGGNITMRSGSSINPYTIVYGHGGATIGSRVRIAAHSVIIPANHGFDDITRPIADQPLTKKGIHISDNVWIGANCTLLDGCHIAHGCIIAAGAVVRGSTEPDGIYGGVPAKRIFQRGSNHTE